MSLGPVSSVAPRPGLGDGATDVTTTCTSAIGLPLVMTGTPLAFSHVCAPSTTSPVTT